MVLDTSALLALLLDEPEAEEFRAAVEEDTTRLVSAATLLETALVIEARKGEPGGRELDALIKRPRSSWSLSTRSTCPKREGLTDASARAVTPPASISAICSRTRWAAPRANPSSSRAMISPRPMSVA